MNLNLDLLLKDLWVLLRRALCFAIDYLVLFSQQTPLNRYDEKILNRKPVVVWLVSYYALTMGYP